jgi:UDP-N-acetylmuramoyl-L-alanyl-D-glutamate--2,6-diaminopimelate ligase
MEKPLSEFFTGEIAREAGLIERYNDIDPRITGVEYDSRYVKPGNIFCALRGLHTDGHRYIGDALARGARAIVYDAEIPEKPGNAVYIRVKDSRFAMSPISAAFYGFPSRRLVVIGVTGTEGKSTTVYLIFQLLRLLGRKAGFLSTVQFSSGGEVNWNPQHQTTPEANAVQKMLWEMAENGVNYAVLEASSHGLSRRTNRLGNVIFDVAVVTNVNHEHLEFHGTWEQYRDDKANLFRALDSKDHEEKCTALNRQIGSDSFSGSASQPVSAIQALPIPRPFGVINADDPSAGFFARATRQRSVTFSAQGMKADLAVQSIESSAWGNWYNILIGAENDVIDIRDKLPGAFNAGNVLAALLTVSELLEIPLRDIAALTVQLQPVRGRMTTIDRGQPFELVVDYAHTPSSFRSIFPPLRKRLDAKGFRIISVFGSAGERDTKKRGEQGMVARDYSDIIILTDEDPRGENPMYILEEIAKGCEAGRETSSGCEAERNDKTGRTFKREENLFLIPDRPKAIRKALRLALPGDLVLLLGKGHENSIIYAEKTMPYDEIGEAESALAEMGFI